MNWFLLVLFILKLFTINWSAPIDLTTAEDVTNVNKATEDVINSTEIPSIVASLSESLHENVNKVTKGIENLTTEVEKRVESALEKVTTEATLEIGTIEEQNVKAVPSDLSAAKEETTVEEISSTSQIPWEITTGQAENVSIDGKSSSLESESQFEGKSVITKDLKSIISDLKSLTEEPEIKIAIAVENKTEVSSEVPSNSNVSDHSNETLFKTTTQDAKLETSTSEKNSIKENLAENLENLFNKSQQLIGNLIDKSTETSVSENLNTDFPNGGTSENAEFPITFSALIANTSNGNEESPNHQQEDNSSEIPALKQSLDSIVNQVGDIGSSLGDSAKKLINESSIIKTLTGNSNNPETVVIMDEKPSIIDHKGNQSFKQAVDSFIEDVVEVGSKLGLNTRVESSEQIATINESKSAETTTVPEVKAEDTNTPFSILEESLKSVKGSFDKIASSLDSSKTDVNEMQLEGKLDEVITTTPPTVENLGQNTQSANLSQSMETVIDAASEIGINFGKAVSGIFSVSENKDESVTKSPNKSTIDSTTEKEANRSVNDSDSLNLSQSLETLVGQASEMGSNFGKTVSDLFSVSENKIQTISDSPIVSGLKTTTPEEDNQSEIHISTTPTSEVTNTGQSVENLTGQASAIGNNFGKTVSNIFSISEYKPESLTKSPIEIVLDSTINTEANQLDIPVITTTENDSQVQHSEGLNFSQSIDTLIGQASEIGSNFDKTFSNSFSAGENKPQSTTENPKEIHIEITIPQEVNQPEINIITTPTSVENDNQIQNSDSEVSNFSQSIDILIGEASEIGKNFGKPVSHLFSPSENKSESSLNEKSTEKLMETTTTPTSVENLNDIQVPITESSKFGRVVETLNGAASEIGNNFYNIVSDLVSVINKKSESVTEIPKESLLETTIPVENVSTASEANSQETVTKPQIVDHENIEVSTTILTPNINETPEAKDITEINDKKGNHFYNGGFIPVAVVIFPESETETVKPVHIKENITNSIALQAKQVHGETETALKVADSVTNNENEIITTSIANDIPIEKLTAKIEDYTTLSSIEPESATAQVHPVIQETANAFNTFGKSLKNFIESETIKQKDKHASASETNENGSLAREEPITTESIESTTMVPKNFEEELQMAVKALEETTHHHFEEFQNNLKEAFKKFTVWGADKQEETTTTHIKATTEVIANTKNPSEEPATTIKPEEGISPVDNIKETYKIEEAKGHSGAIHQQFVDKFADNYEETSESNNIEMPTVKEESNPTEKEKKTLKTNMPIRKEESSQLTLEREIEETTETPIILTTMSTLPKVVEGTNEEYFDFKNENLLMEATTMQSDVQESSASVAKKIVKESSAEEREQASTEYIPKITTTPTPQFARVPLQRDYNSVSLIAGEEAIAAIPTQETATSQRQETKEMKETNTVSTQQPTTKEEEEITLASPESALQEMVTFIEHTDTTTVMPQRHEQQQQHNTETVVEESIAAIQTQEPLTLAAFMEEQQQQIESTTEHNEVAQTPTADTSGQTIVATTVNDVGNDTTQPQTTTETEIHSTTAVADEKEDETEITTTEVSSVEPEPRSLALPPPKLEYLQNEDGVEVFYGYSIVKRN